jgi:hypothetical protein
VSGKEKKRDRERPQDASNSGQDYFSKGCRDWGGASVAGAQAELEPWEVMQARAEAVEGQSHCPREDTKERIHQTLLPWSELSQKLEDQGAKVTNEVCRH